MVVVLANVGARSIVWLESGVAALVNVSGDAGVVAEEESAVVALVNVEATPSIV